MVAEDARPGRFSSLHVPAYRQLLVGGIFSFLAIQMAVIARGWLAFDLTGTNAALGGVLIGFGLASIVAIPMGGVLADRLSKRSILLATATMQVATALALAVAVVTGAVAYWMLLVSGVLDGILISLLGPARLAFIADSVDRDRLTNALFLSQSTLQLTRVFGPATAGALIGVRAVGVEGVYLIAAACALVSLLLTIGLPPGAPLRRSTRSPRHDLADGMRFVRASPGISHLLVFSYLVVLVGFPHIAFLPVVADGIFDTGSSGFGALTTAAALGALGATLGLADLPRSRLWAAQSAAALLFGGSLMLLGAAPVFVGALAAMVAAGATSAAFQSLNNSLVLGSTPVEYHGRVQSLLLLGFSGFGLAALPIGVVADAVGLRETLVGMGVCVVAISLVSIARRRRSEPPASTLAP
jgi:MFS family permease